MKELCSSEVARIISLKLMENVVCCIECFPILVSRCSNDFIGCPVQVFACGNRLPEAVPAFRMTYFEYSN